MTEPPCAWKETPLPDRPIGIVSGFMRCGTSMMMEALGAGGMGLAYEPKRNEMNDQFGDDSYRPNEGGFYEMTRATYSFPDFALYFRGYTFKLLFGGLLRLPVARYQVVFMIRDPEEIRQSYEAFFGKDLPRIGGSDWSSEAYHHVIARQLAWLKNRKDTTLTVLDYRTTVERPQDAFQRLKMEGWPIDPSKAAAIVDKGKCRFKKEELVEGL